jgi:hypothetical protein
MGGPGFKAKLELLCSLGMSSVARTPIPLAHRGTRALSASRRMLVTTKPCLLARVDMKPLKVCFCQPVAK